MLSMDLYDGAILQAVGIGRLRRKLEFYEDGKCRTLLDEFRGLDHLAANWFIRRELSRLRFARSEN
jgi:hypothetical protein